MSHVPGRLGSESLPRHGAPLPEVIEPVPRVAQRMRQDGIGAVDGPITPPLRGSRRSRAARRRLMRWGATNAGYTTSSTSIQASGLCSFQCLSGVGAIYFPPPARLRASPWSCRLPLKGGVIRLGMFENGSLAAARSDRLGLRISMPSRCQFALRPSPHKFVAHPNHLHS